MMDAIMVAVFAYVLETSSEQHKTLNGSEELDEEQGRLARRCGDLVRWLAEDELIEAIVVSYIEHASNSTLIKIQLGPDPAPDVLH